MWFKGGAQDGRRYAAGRGGRRSDVAPALLALDSLGVYRYT
jgi:hypothetical protein